MPSIEVTDEIYQALAEYGHGDESWNDVMRRLLEHLDEQAAIDDKANRETTYDAEERRQMEGNVWTDMRGSSGQGG
ncbi:MAG: antitoxin VapB family protein [Haloarculaceae archaeon]